MTSVYQIIKQYGDMDDYRERIYATYLNLDRALIELQMLQALEDVRIEQGRKCAECQKNGFNLSCSKADYTNGPECKNFDLHQDPYNYYINCIDVIE